MSEKNFNELPPLFQFPMGAQRSEAEDFLIKFRTEDDSAVLFDTRTPYTPEFKRDRLLLMLINGELELILVISNITKQVS